MSTHPSPAVGERPAQGEPAGLRERKKARTRATIREQALRLFRAQGYQATTVEQIAAAAEVSPATFFRHFPTKEDVVYPDDFELVTLSAFEKQPPELGPVSAYRSAVAATFASMTAGDRNKLAESTQLAMSIPEVRARVLDELARTIDVVATAIARRASRNGAVVDDVTARCTAGAIVGVVIATTLTWDDALLSAESRADLPSIFERIDAGLGCLEAALASTSATDDTGTASRSSS